MANLFCDTNWTTQELVLATILNNIAADILAAGSNRDLGGYEIANCLAINGKSGSNPLILKTTGSERMRIDASGKVGIGTGNPGFSAGERLTISNTSSGAKTVALALANEASAANTEVSIAFTPNVNIPLAEISALRTAGGGNTSLVFRTWNGSLTERVRITDAGIVRIANLPQYANNAAAISGGLVAGDLYSVSGANPRTVAVVY